ncbi:MAG: helicase HerA domain-containing protein, partial [Myxococcota bacterium]
MYADPMFRADDYEKLGSFFLGRVLAADGSPTDAPLLYDAKDLTTHGVCVGMTGSGKTGLCLALLEEAALDGVPALAIDPKGDLGNLLLTFPALRPEDFAPWIDAAEASRAGQTPADYAQTTAERWRKGLADWGQAPARIQALRDAAELALYTPGSTAGRPLRLLRSFDAPPPALA